MLKFPIKINPLNISYNLQVLTSFVTRLGVPPCTFNSCISYWLLLLQST